jgi:predicted Zn-dependent peptidase
MCWLVPGGVAYDPIENGDGFASLISEYLFRGAGSLDSRELSEAFDRLGARRSIVAETFFQRFSLTLAGENLYDGLSLMVDLVRTPHVAPDALEAVKSLCLQELNGLDDDPSHLSQLRLDEIRLPPPFDRHGLGTVATLQGATAEALRDHFTTSATPGGMILAASGAVDHDVLEAFLLNALDGMEGETTVPTPRGDVTGGSITLDRATSQSHLSMGFNAPIAADKDMIAFQLAAAILGGGASSRLFSVVREQQGLAYSIGGPARARRLAIDHFRRGSAQSMAEMLEAYDAVDSNEVREVATRWMDEAWRANRTQSLVGPVQP